jgi:hypothetical protein
MHAVAIPAPIYVPWEVRESAAQQRRSGVSPGTTRPLGGFEGKHGRIGAAVSWPNERRRLAACLDSFSAGSLYRRLVRPVPVH